MDDRDGWRERIKGTPCCQMTWWWQSVFVFFYPSDLFVCLVRFYGISNILGYLITKSIFIHINSSVSNNCLANVEFFVYTQLRVKTVRFQIIQVGRSTKFSSIWPIERILSGASTPGQSGPGSDGNEGGLCIPQSFSFTEAWPSDCLMSYQDTRWGSLTPLQRCNQCTVQPQVCLFVCLLACLSNLLLGNFMLISVFF